MLKQCTPLLVKKAGVAPEVTPGITTFKQASVHMGFKTHRESDSSPKQRIAVAPQIVSDVSVLKSER